MGLLKTEKAIEEDRVLPFFSKMLFPIICKLRS